MTLLRRVDPGWLVFAVGLVLRAGWVVVRWTQDGSAVTYPDEDVHWQLARNLVDHGHLVTDDGRWAARMPLYPLFLAWFATIGDGGILLARLAQAALGAATAYVGYRLVRSAFDDRAALVAGLLIAADPFAVFFANLLLTEVLFTFLALSLTACAWHYLARQRFGPALLGLAACGAAAVLTRPAAVAWVPLLWLAVWLGAIDRGRAFVQLLIGPLVLAALLLPWGLRNHAMLGAYAWLSTNGGVTLYDAQGPQADGSSRQEFMRDLLAAPDFDEVTIDRTLQQLAIEQMWRDPRRVLHLAGIKFLRTWSPLPHVAEYRAGIAAQLGAVYTVAALLLALVGLVRAATVRLRRYQLTFWRINPGPRTFHALVWLPVICFTLLHCIYIGSVRYRIPLMPFVALAASTAAARPMAEQQRRNE